MSTLKFPDDPLHFHELFEAYADSLQEFGSKFCDEKNPDIVASLWAQAISDI